jgi:hypothetical protein
MGRSITPVTPAAVRVLDLPASAFSQALDRHYDIYAKNGELYQSEYQLDSAGNDIFRNALPVQWIIGAGMNGFSAIVQRGNYLFEAPLSYYQQAKAWNLSPGYESRDIGFNRPILAGCISCHSGRANPEDEASGRFDPVPFTQAAIGCENCHGPGAAHIRAVTSGTATGGPHIVNPQRLTADLENDICMSCHEAGDSRVLQPGKTYQDFRPGKPLDETFSIFMVPLKPGEPDSQDHVQHSFEMFMSKCFRASGRQLRCATCHNPHVEPTAEEAPTWFNAKCLTCHTSGACTLPLAERQNTRPANNCIACHMPQRQDTRTAHTSLTNHRILAKPGEPWPEEAFTQTTAALPDLVHINRVPGRSADIAPTVLLEAYRQIAEYRPEYAEAYRTTLGELERTNPNEAAVQEGLGRIAFKEGDDTEAIANLRRAVALNPASASAYSFLAQALIRRDRFDEAIQASQKAISLDQFNTQDRKILIDALIAAKQYQKAIEAMQVYMDLFPEDSFMRKMLDMANQ